jgi:hypothetical protein
MRTNGTLTDYRQYQQYQRMLLLQRVFKVLCSGTPSVDELDDALARVGRNDAPFLLLCCLYNRLLTPQAAVATVAGAWSGAEFPQDALTQAD